MMQSTLSNNSAQVSLTAAPRRSVAPLGTSSTSCKRLPHRLCVAVKFGVCVCECGKVTALKHLPFTALPPVPRCRDFNRFFIASPVFQTAPSGTCTTLCLLSASPFVALSPLVLTLRVFIREILFYAAKLWHTAEQQGQVCTPCSSPFRYPATTQSPLLMRQSTLNAILWQCKI